MVVIGLHRARAEIGKKSKKLLFQPAVIDAEDRSPLRQCSVYDVSDNGARIMLSIDCDVPDEFMLVLATHGKTRRRCLVLWREGVQLSVHFYLTDRRIRQ
jgi:hypothetical protein